MKKLPPLHAIREDPHAVVMIDDDTTAKSVLLELGIINHFSDDGRPTKWVEALAYDALSTHHLVVFRFHNFEKKKDNGFAIQFMPRSGYTDPKANHTLIANMQKQYAVSGVPVIIRRYESA